MAVLTFEDFYDALCTLVGEHAPALEPAEDGAVGFSLKFRGARIGFVREQVGAEPAMLMIVEFAVPPADKQQEILTGFLDANYLLAKAGGPCFMRNPVDGMVSLRHTYRLDAVDPYAVLQSMDRAAGYVAEWKQTYFLDPALLRERLALLIPEGGGFA